MRCNLAPVHAGSAAALVSFHRRSNAARRSGRESLWHTACSSPGNAASNLAGSPVEALMILIKHVLVATDFSEPSGAALNYGRELARTFAATLHVLHVADNVTFQYGVEGYSTLLPEMQEDVEASARTQLDALITEEDRVAVACRARRHHRRAQGRRHRPLRQRAPDGPHRDGDAWSRRGQSPLDGECGRAAWCGPPPVRC